MALYMFYIFSFINLNTKKQFRFKSFEKKRQKIKQFSCLRSGGNFGTVRVSWELRSQDNILLASGDDFLLTSGQMDFSPQENRRPLGVSPIADSSLEVTEQFLLVLTQVEGKCSCVVFKCKYLFHSSIWLQNDRKNMKEYIRQRIVLLQGCIIPWWI